MSNQLSPDSIAINNVAVSFINKLPNELLCQIPSETSTANRWVSMGVCKLWRQIFEKTPRFWSQLDLSMFKGSGFQESINHFLALADGAVSTVSWISDRRSLTFPFGPDFFIEESLWRQTMGLCPNVTMLQVNSELSMLTTTVACNNIRSLEIDFGDNGFHYWDMLQPLFVRFANLETLLLTELRKLSVEMNVRTIMSKSLKHLVLRFARSCHKLDAPYIEHGIAVLCPNLETLELLNPRLWDGPRYDSSFEALSNLKSLTIKLDGEDEDEEPVITNLPASMETLVYTTRTPHYFDMSWRAPQDELVIAVPHLPKLKRLETNFDAELTDPPTHYLWGEVMRSAKCKLENVCVERLPCSLIDQFVPIVESEVFKVWASRWLYDLVTESSANNKLAACDHKHKKWTKWISWIKENSLAGRVVSHVEDINNHLWILNTDPADAVIDTCKGVMIVSLGTSSTWQYSVGV